MAVVPIQGGLKMAFARREDPALTRQHTAICGLLTALGWEHPSEKDPDHVLWAPRTIIYPVDTADLIPKIRTGHSNLIPDDRAGVRGDIGVLISAWERNVDFKMFSHEEALATDPIIASWILFAQNGALGAHTYILEDGPELPKSSGPGAPEGGEVLEGMSAQGCTTIEESRIHGRSERAGGHVSAAGGRSGPAGIVSNDHRIVPT
jgi:hypothetical protein